nr:hypothetical protein [Gemmatimonadaceae bacterium]
LTTFLAAWWSTTHRTGTGGGGIALTVLLWSGLVGTLCGGPLADRIGRRRVIAAALALATPCLVATFLAGDAPWTLPLLGLGGAFLFAPFSVMVVLGQEYLPRHLGTAAGMTLGMALTVGGIAAPLLGALADRRGVQAMLLAVSWIPLLAALLAVRLPDPASHRG